MKLYAFFLGTFKFLCVLITVIMVGYWIYKYDKNDDQTSIEYLTLNETTNFVYPEVTICFIEPYFTNDLLKSTEQADFNQAYRSYLTGMYEMNETFIDLDYEKTSPNLFDYFEMLTIEWKPIAKSPEIYSNWTNITKCPYFKLKNSYNGFDGNYFLKCFGLEVKHSFAPNMYGVSILFNNTLNEILKKNQRIQVLFNYPNQFLRYFGGVKGIWPNSKRQLEIFQITSAEILNRRNIKKRPCTHDLDTYDELVLKRHLDSVGCRPPYINRFKNISICNTKEEMKKVRFEGKQLQSKYLEVPCQEMPYIEYNYFPDPGTFGTNYSIWFTYPQNIKLVTHSKDVDAHSLIGNLGGYIGLFLGCTIIQLPELTTYLINWIVLRMPKNCCIYARKSAGKNKTGKLKSSSHAGEPINMAKNRNGNLRSVPYLNSILQLKLNIALIQKRMNDLAYKVDDHGKKLDEILSMFHSKY